MIDGIDYGIKAIINLPLISQKIPHKLVNFDLSSQCFIIDTY